MRKRLSPALLGLLLAAATPSASATGRAMPTEYLHPLFSDHAVLQRDMPLRIWGTAGWGEQLTVTFAGQTRHVKADDQGHWSCTLDPMPASFESRTLQVSNHQLNKADMATDILVGDVWLCSGQSNMEWPITQTDEDEEIAKADHPHLRLLTIPHEVAYKPQSMIDSKWQHCSPETLRAGAQGGFSAVAYFFGRKLQEELKVPIGLIHSSWGGTMIEAWMSAETLQGWHPAQGQMNLLRNIAESNDPKALDKIMDEWFMKHDIGTQQGWHKGTQDTSDWKEVDWPNSWAGCGIKGHEGITWIQREFELPADWETQPLVFQLGTIADTDTTWINGTEIGRTNSFEVATEYTVPVGIVKAGKNTITMRITNAGGGGIHNKNTPLTVSPLHITPAEAHQLDPILSGKWKLKTTATKGKTGRPIAGNPRVPTVLHNAMIAPLKPCALKGVIWYQGEANAGAPKQYAKLLPMMIADWRKQFDHPELAFHIVSLANYMERSEVPRDHGWAGLREAQAMAARNVPHCGLAVTIDIGDAKDIHPKNKRDVGLRLALSALERTYGKDLVGSGPWYREMKIEGDKLRLDFDYAEGLQFRGEVDKAFAIAGKDGKFVWAKAEIHDKSVLVSSPEVPEPIAVRYAWDANPQAPLYNAAGLPAVPFRSGEQ